MSDPNQPTDTTTSDESADSSEPTTPTADSNTTDPTDGVTGWDDTLLKGALAILALLALVATIRFYLSLSSAITTWVSHEFRDLVQAAFNLVVLLVTGVGISLILRQLSERR